MRLLIIGQNPAKGHEDDVPFVGTRSGHRLFTWLRKAGIDIDDCKFVNLWYMEGKLPASFILSAHAYATIRDNYFDRVITVGKVADKYVSPLMMDEFYLNIPHPSGLNRQLNKRGIDVKIIRAIRRLKWGTDETTARHRAVEL